MKHKIIWLVCSLILVLIPLRAYWHAGVPYTHDGENHLARFANYKLALKEGQVPPRFAPNLMNRYGYPVFNYNYPLPSIASLPFSWLKLPYTLTFKLLIAASLLFGLAGIAAIAKKNALPLVPTLIGQSAYIYNPYLISAILIRGSIGEVMIYSLFPWLWWMTGELRERQQPLKALFGIALFTAFFLSHNVGVLIGTPLLLLLALTTYTAELQSWKRWIFTVGAGLGLSLWFWIPAFMEKSLVVLDQAGLSTTVTAHLPVFQQLLFAPTQFGFSMPGYVDSLGFSVGLWQFAALLILSVIWFKQRSVLGTQRHLALLFFVLGWGLLLLQQPFSSYLWETVPFVRFIQFPWRLTLFWPVIISVWLMLWWGKVPKSLKVVLLLIALFQVVYLSRIKPVDYRYLTNADYDAFPQSTTTANENLPKEFTYLQIGDWQPSPTFLSGAGSFEIEYWKGSDRKYKVVTTEESVIVEPTMVFAGWETTINGTNNVSYLQSSEIAGRLAYMLPAGEYQVRSRFTQNTPARRVGNGATLFTAFIVGAWCVYTVKKA